MQFISSQKGFASIASVASVASIASIASVAGPKEEGERERADDFPQKTKKRTDDVMG